MIRSSTSPSVDEIITAPASMPWPESDSSPSSVSTESDVVIILGVLLCGLVSIFGLTVLSRRAWNYYRNVRSTSIATSQPKFPPDRGLKKKIILSLPKFVFDGKTDHRYNDCAICLSEFINGDEIRVLAPCEHGFHVTCIDIWLTSHSSCPSCRHILVVSRCRNCGEIPSSSDKRTYIECTARSREDNMHCFLP